MARYVDGFVLPIPRDRLDNYRSLVEAVAQIWKEHGALDYLEFVGDDMKLEGTRSFTDLVAATDDEAVIFGWVVFESRQARDEVNKKVATDPRMEELVATADTGFDAQRMVYGGFQSLINPADEDVG